MALTWFVFALLALKCQLKLSSAQVGPCKLPPDFPLGIQLNIESFETFGREIKIPFAYVATARNSKEVVTITNWAYQNGYRVRAMGSKHNWSPLAFSPSDNNKACPNTILVDTKKYFTSMIVHPPDLQQPDLHSVSVGTGVKLRVLLEFLEKNGLGLFSSPTVGGITIGGILAVGAHGSGFYSEYDKKSPGHSYGTISNLVIQMTIVAWDENISEYVLKTLHRSEEDTKAFLVNLGRTFVTSVTLRVGKNQMLRSETFFYIPVEEAYANPYKLTESTRTIAKFAESYGRIFATRLPPGKMIAIQTWHSEPIKPTKSRLKTGLIFHYHKNYLPLFLENSLRFSVTTIPSLAKFISIIGYYLLVVLSVLTRSVDYWGASKNMFMFGIDTAPRVTANPFTFITSRDNVQLVLHIFHTHFEGLSAEYAKIHQYPTPGLSDVRITGLDFPKDVEIPGGESPSLSPIRPVPEYPDYDSAIWIDLTGYLETPYLYEFMTRLQSLLYRDIHGKFAIIRAEWSKGWAITESGAWTNVTVMNHYSRTFSNSDRLEEWNWAVKTLNSYDPHRVFSNSFLDAFLVEH